jgi:predicted ATP-grasp superfamily ATP-dependent carboligase
LLGVTRQLIGTPWLGARGFRYAGSLGPVPLDPEIRQQWQRIGECLSRGFRLQGLFGVDAVQSEGRVVPVEVNPRYTASIEVLERATGLLAIVHHAHATRLGRLLPMTSGADDHVVGKGILYATGQTRVLDSVRDQLVSINRSASLVQVADIPATDRPIDPGRPVVTLLVRAEDLTQAETELGILSDRVRRLLPPVVDAPQSARSAESFSLPGSQRRPAS